MACSCCLTSETRVSVNGADISGQVNSINVDSSQEVLYEDSTDASCSPMGSEIYLFGPGKTTIQITAYPFEGEDDYTMGFECPISVSMNSGYRWVYDCRFCSECITSGGGKAKRRGKWRSIEMKKKQISITGEPNALFDVGGCSLHLPKLSVQAGPHPAIYPQYSSQYSKLKYLGKPISFDSTDLSSPFTISVTMSQGCPGFSGIEANLTGFQFNFTPPQPPTVTYSFEAMVSVCPTC
jgi:hypothetical protein